MSQGDNPDPARRAGGERLSLLLAVGVVGAIAALVLPMPAPVLDFLIALNLAGSIAILLAALFATDTARLSVFPTILLLATLFRLAINVSSTRLLLLTSEAGRIIHSFGDFVVGGNFIVGGAVFGVLLTIQFLVVAKGSDRASEVRGRFTLDRQQIDSMRIDAELRQGMVTPAEAKARHDRLDITSDMAASMTGALKFVKGDTIAGMVITVVNLVGGIVVGVLDHQMELPLAAQHFAKLTIADALVQQISSMLITIAAGVVVTRVFARRSGGDGGGLGADIFEQLLRQPRPMALTGVLLLVLAATGPWTGLPPVQCSLLGLGAVALAFLARNRAATTASHPAHAGKPAAAQGRDAGAVEIALAIGPELRDVFFTEGQVAREFGAGVARIAERLHGEIGIAVPPVRLTAAPAGIDPRGYLVKIAGSLVATGRLEVESAAITTAARLRELGIAARGGPSAAHRCEVQFVDAAAAPALREQGIAVRSPLECALDHLAQSLRRAGRRFVDMQATRDLLASLQPSCPDLVNAAERAPGLPRLTAVLQQLLDDQFSIVDLRAILGAVVAVAQDEASTPEQFVDAARLAVSARTCDRLAAAGYKVPFYRLAPLLERQLGMSGGYLAAGDLEQVRQSLAATVDGRRHAFSPPLVVADASTRRAVSALLGHLLPDAIVLAATECARQYHFELVAVLGDGLQPRAVSPIADPALAGAA